MRGRLTDWADRHWRLIVVAAWLLAAAWMITSRWSAIHGFALGDTDDNMRMSQVRALLAGQDWFDLRQYKLDPPGGANIHWTRMVDLPLAGLMLAGRMFLSGADAEKLAITVAPLLPYLLLGLSLALTVRRLVAPLAYLPALAVLFFAGATNNMFMPTRIDHHGWQIALLALAVSGLADPRRRRGGLTLGVASALSLAIGIEMLVYLALAGASVALFWVIDRDERSRLASYAVTLAGGTALAFLLFASHDNRRIICDALSPVWLSDALVGGALLYGLSLLRLASWQVRLAAAAAAAFALAAWHLLAWPDCLSPLAGVSPELRQLWLDHVREVRPVWRHGWRAAATLLALPAAGAIGWLAWAWHRRSELDQLRRVLAAAAPALLGLGLMFWQTRAGPAAQMLAVPGAVALGWLLVPRLRSHRLAPVRIGGTILVVLIASGALVPIAVRQLPPDPKAVAQRKAGAAARRCPTLAALRPIALQPKGIVFTFNDLSPRVITVTHHLAIAGPYHRNEAAITDVQRAFRGSAEQARAIIRRHRADYLLICPGFGEATIYVAESRSGFYASLERGWVPDWLEPVELPPNSPLRLFRVKR